MKKIHHSSLIYVFLIAITAYAFWGQYELHLSKNNIADLESRNYSYQEELENLQAISASSTEAFNELYITLAKVVEEEGIKNKTLSDQVQSLDKLTKADPQLLKKYSKVYFLNENYKPVELQTIVPMYLANKSAQLQLHVDVMYYLVQMIEAAKQDGLNILVVSAYRSFETQASLKSQKKILYGANTANRFVAEQGYSEHQLGTTLDLTNPTVSGANTAFDRTKEYEWLQNNAYKYGFILSYPKGNTYYAYEPWHWRFVGKALALQLHTDAKNFYDLDQRVIDGYLVNMFDR